MGTKRGKQTFDFKRRGGIPIPALFMVVDRIATELWEIRSSEGDALRILRVSEWPFRRNVRDALDPELWLPHAVSVRGGKEHCMSADGTLLCAIGYRTLTPATRGLSIG